MHTSCDIAVKAWQDARQAAGSRDWIFCHLQALADGIVFETWNSLLDVAADKVKIPLWPGAGNPCKVLEPSRKTRRHRTTNRRGRNENFRAAFQEGCLFNRIVVTTPASDEVLEREMRRSEINEAIRAAEAMIDSHGFNLPPLAKWDPDEWNGDPEDLSEIKKIGLGWDITDFGKGRFDAEGLVLFTLRNGQVAPDGEASGVPYAEKLLISRVGQVALLHYHKQKTEDIIVRGGAPLAVKLFSVRDDGSLDRQGRVKVRMDGMRREVEAGGIVHVERGASITLEPGCAHEFWGHEGDCLVGEVSSVNDDVTDNYFFEPTSRFPEIVEDEQPYRLIVPDYLRSG